MIGPIHRPVSSELLTICHIDIESKYYDKREVVGRDEVSSKLEYE